MRRFVRFFVTKLLKVARVILFPLRVRKRAEGTIVAVAFSITVPDPSRLWISRRRTLDPHIDPFRSDFQSLFALGDPIPIAANLS